MTERLLSLALLLNGLASAGESALRERIVFLGSSSTDGFTYPMLVRQALEAAGKPVPLLHNAGAGGNTASDMLKRFDRDAGSWKPVRVVIQSGVNDASKAVPLGDYLATVRQLIERAKASGASVVLLTPNRIGAKHGEINLTFNYPLGWALDNDLSSGLLAASDLHHFAGGPLVSGQCGVLVMPLPDDLIADVGLGTQYQVMTIANALFTEMFLSNRPYERISQVKPLDTGARSAASLSTSATDGDNLFILLEQKGGFVLFIGMTAYNELEASRDLFLHIAGTVRCTPRR